MADLPPTDRPTPTGLDRWLGPFMSGLSLLFLVLAAGFIHRLGQGHITFFEAEVILWGLAALWPLFVFEGLLRAWCGPPGEGLARRLAVWLLICVVPPARLGVRSYADPGLLWLPWLGWRAVDKALRKELERIFSVPMIIMALLVLPFLTLEFMWAEEVRQHFALALFLDIGTSTIWLAFAIEFIVMVSVAENKASYSLRHWTDLAVVVLPMLDFLPFLRLMRLGRVLQMQQLTRMSRVYRLRALLMKVWRAALLLEVIQRIFGRSPAARLKRLRDLLAAKEEELAELRLEIEQLERQVQAQAVPVADAAAPAELDRCG